MTLEELIVPMYAKAFWGINEIKAITGFSTTKASEIHAKARKMHPRSVVKKAMRDDVLKVLEIDLQQEIAVASLNEVYSLRERIEVLENQLKINKEEKESVKEYIN